MQHLLDNFSSIQRAYTSVKLEHATINTFMPPFSRDYFMYWGEIKTAKKNHLVLWIICRIPVGISAEQVNLLSFLLRGVELLCIIRNSMFIIFCI